MPTYSKGKYGNKVRISAAQYRKWGEESIYSLMEKYWRSDDKELKLRVNNVITAFHTGWMDEETKKRYADAAAAVSMQRQKEFIPYS